MVEPGVQCGAVETGPGSLGAHGMQPWGDVLLAASATGPGSLTVSREFKVELPLRSAAAGEGSWVCLAFDERGRADDLT